MIISLGCDHAGFPLKEAIVNYLENNKYKIIDHGTFSSDPVDFPDIARRVCNSITNGEADRGIMICGSGVGASIACNKFRGIRAFCCHDIYSAHQSVEHDDVNIACIGADVVGPKRAIDLLSAYLAAEFSNKSEFAIRIKKLDEIEKDQISNSP